MNQKYLDLLKDPRWQKKRLKIMERDNFTCQICKDKESTIAIHHKRYSFGKKPWEYEDEDLLTVCEDCHTLIREVKEINIGECSIPVKSINENSTIYYVFFQGRKYLELCIIQKQQNIFLIIDSIPVMFFKSLLKSLLKK